MNLPQMTESRAGRLVLATLAMLPRSGPVYVLAAAYQQGYLNALLPFLAANKGLSRDARVEAIEDHRWRLLARLDHLLHGVNAKGGVN